MRVLPIAFSVLFLSCVLDGAEPSAEVARYHEMLRKRPQLGVVFERFTDTWLASGTTDDLKDFLTQKAGDPAATAAAQLLLAFFLTRQGSEKEALEAFAKALEKEPQNTPAWLERSRLEVRMLDFNAALKSLDSALAQHPEPKLAVDLAKLRGRVLLRTGKPEEALQAWRALLGAHPDDEDLAEELVDVQLDEGLSTEASDTMRALIAKTKDPYAKVSRRLRLAEILARSGNKAEALAQLAECLAQSGRDTWIEGETLAQIEQIFRREDNLSGLAEHLTKLQAGGEERVAVQRQLARVQAETGDKDKALAAYAALLEKTPGRRDLRESYLDLLERFEKFADAMAQTKLLIEQNPGDKELQLRLATVQQRAGDPKAAAAVLDAYLAVTGTGEYDHLRVARMLEQWGRKDDAKAAYARMVATFPASTGAKEAQAHFLHRIEERDNAIAIWRELAAKGGLEEVLAVAQALLARVEPQAAFEILRARHAEFGQETRFLAPLITASAAIKEHKSAVPWAMDRVRLTQDAAMLDDAIHQALDVLEAAKETASSLASLKAAAMPSFPERALLAALLEESGDRDASEKTLRQAPAEQTVPAQTRLVRLIESRQDWPRAADELQKLIAMPEGRSSQHAQRLVDLRQRAGEPETALKLIPDWKTLSPGAVQPWLTEAGLLAQLNRPQESLQVLRAASRKYEDDDTVAAALATAYVDAGQFADAERIFLKLVEKAEALEEKLRWVAALAQTAQSRGMLKAVTEKFQERQRTNRADATPWLALAEIHRVAENKAEQRRCFTEAARLRPKDVSLLQDIARVEEDMGDWKQALRTLEQASALDTSPRTKQLIAIVQLRWGDENEAFRMLIDLFG
ncbi:MAG: tetratricopeptide repeat protein, partial [Roseimicrobium sp.]